MNILRRGLAAVTLFLLPVLAFAQEGLGGGNTTGLGGGNTQLPNPLNGGVDSISSLVDFVLTNIVLPIGSVVIVIMIIYAGFLFVTARGSEDKISTAKHMLLYIVIGAAILLGATVISHAISGTLCQIAPNLPNCPR